MNRRLVEVTVLSVAVTVALVASVPEKRTATIRLEIWVLAVLGAVLLVHLMRARLPLTADPLARRAKPEAEVDDPAAVESLAVAFTLAPSTQERIRRSAHIQLRDALRTAGAPIAAQAELPATLDGWAALLDEIEAS
jgi:hypothetical protein